MLTSNDSIVALCDTTVGRDTVLSPQTIGYLSCQSPSSAETVSSILDGNLETKHVNYGIDDASVILLLKGVGTGFALVPSAGNMSVLQAFQFGTANDAPERDPITLSIEGSRMSDQSSLQRGSSWNLIYLGWTGIDGYNDPGRRVYGNVQNISQAVPYKAYRFLIASQRAAGNCVQYSEIRLIGYFLD